MLLQMALLHSFYAVVIFHCVCVCVCVCVCTPHLLCPQMDEFYGVSIILNKAIY